MKKIFYHDSIFNFYHLEPVGCHGGGLAGLLDGVIDLLDPGLVLEPRLLLRHHAVLLQPRLGARGKCRVLLLVAHTVRVDAA